MSDEIDKPITGRAKGGVERAKRLTPEKRSEIAKKAAAARYAQGGALPKADYKGQLAIGDILIPCAVLNDGRRVLSERGITDSFFSGRPNARQFELAAGAGLPVFVAQNELKSLIDKEFWSGAGKPIEYQNGDQIVVGFEASILPVVCDVWLKARQEDLLSKTQKGRAEKAEILMRALAHVAINALVDEATGYQEVRPKNALQAYLEMLIRKELAAWAKKFPDEFYENIYKLKGWPWPGMGKNRYSVVAHYTRDLVYERLAPGILKELENKSPKNESGHRQNKLHEWLTDDIGNPLLAQHLHTLIMFQRSAIANGFGWNRFLKMVDQVMPKKGATLELPLGIDDNLEEKKKKN
ncbi:P63C domain-containing protein [Collimonas sp.]|jgi:hypothetical protein|uniref:P63C domain-containing protein n=1 Tax=Collimonas sp. TaxID=1963772 RepID=UPI002BC6BB50|nr:P63C domain-containing protein [Collimonas sp.]HWW05613.1 P63C domain-containing protein [Collimonas sp.]